MEMNSRDPNFIVAESGFRRSLNQKFMFRNPTITQPKAQQAQQA
jgi:hypothetical protein